MAQEWIQWADSKKFFGPPPSKNILVLLQKQNASSNPPPDAPLSAELCAFNLAVMAQPESLLIPFLVVYCHAGDKPTKVYADNLGIERPAFYDRAHKAAGDIYKQHLSIIDMHRSLQREVEGFAL